MAYDEALAQRVRTQLAEESNIIEKKMFGGLCFLLNDNMLCGIDNKSRLMLRVGIDRYDELLALKNAEKMNFTGKTMKGMIYVSTEGISSERNLKKWLGFALRFVSTLPKKKKS